MRGGGREQELPFPRGIAAAAYAKNMPPAYFYTLRGAERMRGGGREIVFKFALFGRATELFNLSPQSALLTALHKPPLRPTKSQIRGLSRLYTRGPFILLVLLRQAKSQRRCRWLFAISHQIPRRDPRLGRARYRCFRERRTSIPTDSAPAPVCREKPSRKPIRHGEIDLPDIQWQWTERR